MSALAPPNVVKRLEQVIWVLDYLDDIDADFLRFYHLDGFADMDSVRFFRLVYRLPVYGGVVARRIEMEQEKAKKHIPMAPTVKQYQQVNEVPLSAFSQYID